MGLAVSYSGNPAGIDCEIEQEGSLNYELETKQNEYFNPKHQPEMGALVIVHTDWGHSGDSRGCNAIFKKCWGDSTGALADCGNLCWSNHGKCPIGNKGHREQGQRDIKGCCERREELNVTIGRY
jgi:hypothetical protein